MMQNDKKEAALSREALKAASLKDARTALWRAKMDGLCALEEESKRNSRRAFRAGLAAVLAIAVPWFVFLFWLCDALGI